MGAVLAAVLGQIGLPGGGYAYALGAIAYYGRRYNSVPTPTLSQARNGVTEFIPVARIADMESAISAGRVSPRTIFLSCRPWCWCWPRSISG